MKCSLTSEGSLVSEARNTKQTQNERNGSLSSNPKKKVLKQRVEIGKFHIHIASLCPTVRVIRPLSRALTPGGTTPEPRPAPRGHDWGGERIEKA